MKQLNKDVTEYKLTEIGDLLNLTKDDTLEQLIEKFSTLSNYWVIGWVDPETKKDRVSLLVTTDSIPMMFFMVWWKLKVKDEDIVLYAFSDARGKPIYDKEIAELTIAEKLKSIL